MQDMDPDQGVEEEFYRKKDHLFCWRFLRNVSYTDQSMFQVKKEGKMIETFTGNVESVCK